MLDEKMTICPICGIGGVARQKSFILKIDILKLTVKFGCLSCDSEYIKEYDLKITDREIICQQSKKNRRHFNDE